MKDKGCKKQASNQRPLIALNPRDVSREARAAALDSNGRQLDAVIRNHFFDLMASVVLLGLEDVTQSEFP